MNPKFVRNFLIVRSLSDCLNYIKIYPDIFCIQILLSGVYPVAWNLSGHFLSSDFLFVQIPDIRKFRTAIFIIFWVKRQVYSGHIRQYPDIFDNIFRTLFFHRDCELEKRFPLKKRFGGFKSYFGKFNSNFFLWL